MAEIEPTYVVGIRLHPGLVTNSSMAVRIILPLIISQEPVALSNSGYAHTLDLSLGTFQQGIKISLHFQPSVFLLRHSQFSCGKASFLWDCRFSHEATKIQTTQLLILLIFYFNDV